MFTTDSKDDPERGCFGHDVDVPTGVEEVGVRKTRLPKEACAASDCPEHQYKPNAGSFEADFKKETNNKYVLAEESSNTKPENLTSMSGEADHINWLGWHCLFLDVSKIGAFRGKTIFCITVGRNTDIVGKKGVSIAKTSFHLPCYTRVHRTDEETHGGPVMFRWLLEVISWNNYGITVQNRSDIVMDRIHFYNERQKSQRRLQGIEDTKIVDS
ncbi:hypothetical protein BJ508DRAFT_322988 [Ascobolus immersus RN42]|uniref:Uncharacterized protein n=1 Tax=Ascobolus immersus RN42 TaxID=1160509 RepID=A0A3N4IH49_ASCIM|nr:hypothetical protein BJ508DRAFT_322988 [Ascobolus immersus RN42]